MANVIPFHVKPPMSSVGFGFGMSSSMSAGWPASQSPHSASALFQLTSNNINQPTSSRSRKRGHDDDSSDNVRYSQDDESMENKSPVPDRPKRSAPKRSRVSPSVETLSRDPKSKELKSDGGNDVDAGILLASLPQQAHLSILLSLLKDHPSLKTHVLKYIPRPTLQTALNALSAAAKKLTDAFPYSTTPTFSQYPQFTSNSALGFGFGQPQPSSFPGQTTSDSAIRREYAQSRVRMPCEEFASACMSYAPYFSRLTSAGTSTHSEVLDSQHKDRYMPAESFQFLAAITHHVLAQHPYTQDILVPLVGPRLLDEWNAWVALVDNMVNVNGRLFGMDTASSWRRTLNDIVDSPKLHNGLKGMKVVRDKMVEKFGWLSSEGQPMQI